MSLQQYEWSKIIDNGGCLVEPGEWNEVIAENPAKEEGLELAAEHWQIIKFMREYYAEHLTAPDSRFVVKYLSEKLNYDKNEKKII